VRVHEKHAVAVTLDGAVHDVVAQGCDACRGRDDFDAIIERRDEPGVGATTAASGEPDAFRVHFGPGHQVIECADSIPCLDSGRRVTPRNPPPAVHAIRAVVDSGDLAELKGVDYQADVAVPREPRTMMLIGGLVTENGAVLRFHLAVPADVKNRGEFSFDFWRPVKVRGYIKPGLRLKMELLDKESIAVDLTCLY